MTCITCPKCVGLVHGRPAMTNPPVCTCGRYEEKRNEEFMKFEQTTTPVVPQDTLDLARKEAREREASYWKERLVELSNSVIKSVEGTQAETFVREALLAGLMDILREDG